MTPACPNLHQLEAYLRGELADASEIEIEEHLQSCASCRRQMEQLVAGGMEGVPQLEPASSSPALDKAMRALLEAGMAAASKPRPDPMFQPGTTLRYFGDYEILAELGRGGMGVVYRARQTSLNRPVALKLILAGQLAAPAEVRRFHAEAEAVAMLDHPNIVEVYEIGEHEGRHYFSMKLVEGSPLSARLRGLRSTRSPREIASLVAQVAQAVHYAHQRGILHRDLKPGNILLDSTDRPHLTDFGLAKILEQDTGLTRTHAIMGTPDYMAPEVATGKQKEVTTAADVFSLGAILYELLTGRPPFHEETAAATIQRVLNSEPRRPRAIEPSVPRDLETIALKCLEKEPTRRYSSAAAVGEELERVAQGRTILARRGSLPERVWRWACRKPVLAGLVAALHIVFALGFTGIVWQWRRAEKQGQRAQSALTRLEIEHANALLQTPDTAKALAHLARSLRQHPHNRLAVERLLSALTLRPLALPLAPLRHGPALKSWTARPQDHLGEIYPFHFPGSVVAANFSPDGRRLVTASEDGTARIWDALTGDPIGEPLRHRAEVLWAEFSPDGKRVVTASMDRTARTWDANTGAPLSSPMLHEDIVWHAAFSPDGREVITASEDKTARIWDATTGAPVAAPLRHRRPVRYAAFSSDGRYILTAERGFLAYVWNRVSGQLIGEFGHRFRPKSSRPFPRFSPGKAQLLTIRTTSACLWDFESRPARAKPFETDLIVRAAEFLADPAQIVVAAGSQAQVIDISTGLCVMSLSHPDDIVGLRSSADGKYLITASVDRMARVWDLRPPGRLLAKLPHEAAVLEAGLSRDMRRAVTVPATDTAWLWDLRFAPPVIVCSNLAAVQTSRFSPDGGQVVSATARATTLWEATTGRKIEVLPDKHNRWLRCVDAYFGPHGPRVARVSGYSPIVQVQDLSPSKSGGIELVLSNHVEDVQFSPNGRLLLTASADHTAAVWDAEIGQRLFTMVHQAAVNAAVWSPDGRWIATGSADQTARVWDAANGHPRTGPLRHRGRVKFVLFDPLGQRLATACDDASVHLWSPSKGVEVTQPLKLLDSVQRSAAFCFSPDGDLLATTAGASVQLWDTATGKSLLGPLYLATSALALRFSPDGQRIVVATVSGAAVILDAETGQTVSEFSGHGGPLNDAEFSPDGIRIVTSSSDHTASIWPVPRPPMPAPAWLPELAEALAGQRLNAQGVSQIVPVENLYRLRQKLTTEPASNYYVRWAHRFFADDESRLRLPPPGGH